VSDSVHDYKSSLIFFPEEKISEEFLPLSLREYGS